MRFKGISCNQLAQKKLLIEISRSFTSLTCLTWEVCLKLEMVRWWSLLVLLKRVKCRDVSVGCQLTQMRLINTDRLQGGRIASHFTSMSTCPQNICMNYIFDSEYWLATGSNNPHSQVGWQYTHITHHFWALGYRTLTKKKLVGTWGYGEGPFWTIKAKKNIIPHTIGLMTFPSPMIWKSREFIGP